MTRIAMTEPKPQLLVAWRAAGPDLLAFAVGLGVAAWAGWNTTALVWSLWLSSLVVGYVSIVVTLLRAAQTLSGGVGAQIREGMGAGAMASKIILWGGVVFLLAFFTVHFGGFHWGHSIFLQSFFPVDGGSMRGGFPKAATYWTVVKQNAWFLPLALVAQRDLFRKKEVRVEGGNTTKEIQEALGEGMRAPYKNVIRLHLLIFFFAFAMILRLPAAVIYGVVYAVYFFPWRILRRKTA